MQSQSNQFLIKLHADRNTLWVKHATPEKVESLRIDSIYKLDNMANSSSIFNTKYVELSTKW